jgi:Peptidase M50B-like
VCGQFPYVDTGNMEPVHAVIAGCIVGVAVTVWLPLWKRIRYFGVLVHELGHALMGLATGRRLHSIRVNMDSSGATTTAGNAHGLGRILTTMSGYPAPGIVGALVLFTMFHWEPSYATYAAAGVLLLGVPFWRGWLTWGVVLVVAAFTFGLWWVPNENVTIFGWSAVAGFLIAASPRMITELHRARRSTTHETGHSDADTLATLTVFPAILWEGVFMVLTFLPLGLMMWQATK